MPGAKGGASMASFTFVYVLREREVPRPRTYVGWSTDVEARLAAQRRLDDAVLRA